MRREYAGDRANVCVWGERYSIRDEGRVREWTWASKAGGGGRSKVEKSAGDVPPEIMIFQHLFYDTYENFAFSTIFKIKWPKSE